MKTTIKTIILAAASLFAAMSCQKEMAGTQDLVKEGETIQVSIDAGLGDFVAADATKATATPVVRLTWAAGDQVDAYYGTTKLNTDPITVTPSENGIFAKLSGEINATGLTSGTSVITFVYSNVSNTASTGEAPTFDFSTQNTTDIPFVAYATLVYDGATTLTAKMVEFKFATSVMKIAATNLGGGDISNATISGINTKVKLSPSTSDAAANIVSGDDKGTITKTAGIDASTDKTRAIFTVGLVPDNNTGRSITISQGDFTNKGAITSATIESSKSYTTPASLFTCGTLGIGENAHDYVLIAGTKWATQNLSITASGKKGWKGGNTSAVKVPGTNEDVIVGDYFQWAASYAGYNLTEESEKTPANLLLYTSFDNEKCGDEKDKFYTNGGDLSKRFNQTNAPYGGTDYTQYTSTTGTMNLGKTDDVANILWKDTWRMPTSAEFKKMREATYWAWDSTDCGYYVFMPGLGTSGAANGRGGIASTDVKSSALLFFPAAGYGHPTSLSDAGARGYYWSSSLGAGYTDDAYRLVFNSDNVNPQSYDYRYYGFSVRPVSD